MTKDYEAPPETVAYAGDLFKELEITGFARPCVACGGTTTYEHEYDNALIVELFGGYGLFFDSLTSGNYTLVFCHDCAHDACDKLPWLNALLKPADSHSHTQEYKESHPDHYGWDYDFARDMHEH